MGRTPRASATATTTKPVASRTVRAISFFMVWDPFIDGPAPYFTFVSMGNKENLLDQFYTVKRAASEALLKNGGTITHHHAVGRMHRPQYDRQRPELFADALRSAKREFDPKWILNPGVLIDH